MLMFELIAEQRIAEAIERGELADLPGAGRPLDLGDDPLVPEDLRLAYRILKNAGFVPPELEARREIRALEALVQAAGSEGDAADALRKLRLLRLQLAECSRRGALGAQSEYFRHIVQRLRQAAPRAGMRGIVS
jgi:DnaJ homologue, subfamily C, member 28, conserved domain